MRTKIVGILVLELHPSVDFLHILVTFYRQHLSRRTMRRSMRAVRSQWRRFLESKFLYKISVQKMYKISVQKMYKISVQKISEKLLNNLLVHVVLLHEYYLHLRVKFWINGPSDPQNWPANQQITILLQIFSLANVTFRRLRFRSFRVFAMDIFIPIYYFKIFTEKEKIRKARNIKRKWQLGH